MAVVYLTLAHLAREGGPEASCLRGTSNRPCTLRVRFDMYEDNDSTVEVDYYNIPLAEEPTRWDYKQRRRYIHNCSYDDDHTGQLGVL